MPHKVESQLRSDYIWNTASSVMASGSTVLMLLVVTRVSGIYLAGVFALAIAIGQQFQSLGMYEVRTYQATDVRSRFTFGTYHSTRIITTFLMLIGVVLYPALGNQPREDIVLIILIASLRLIDAFEDVFLGELQRRSRLDLAGKAYFFRVTTTTLVFCGTLLATQNLFLTTIITLTVSLLALLGMVIWPSSRHFSIRPLFTFAPIRGVLAACLPLFLAAFLAVYLSNAPRFAIAAFMDNDYQGYFAILFMPAFTVNLLSTLMFRPLLTRMAHLWNEGDKRGFRRLILRGLEGAAIGFALVFVATYLIGVPLLNLLYAEDISAFRPEMMILVSGGAFNAASIILYYALTTMRKQHAVLIGYVGAGAAVLVLSTILVSRYGIMGAATAYLCAMVLLTSMFAATLFYYFRSKTPALPAVR